MNLKRNLIEFVVKHDLISSKIKWKENASAVGSLYRNVFDMVDKEDRVKLTKMMGEWGSSSADELVKRLKVERDLHGCAIALVALHRIFGIKSSIVEENKSRVKIHIKKCEWKDKENWKPEICASMAAYETGLVRGVNRDVKHFYTKRRSKGDDVCELILEVKKSIR